MMFKHIPLWKLLNPHTEWSDARIRMWAQRRVKGMWAHIWVFAWLGGSLLYMLMIGVGIGTVRPHPPGLYFWLCLFGGISYVTAVIIGMGNWYAIERSYHDALRWRNRTRDDDSSRS